jgi:hypothetical protein
MAEANNYDPDAPESRIRRVLGVIGFLFFFGLAGGALGYLWESGALEMLQRPDPCTPAYRHATRLVTETEYERQTRRGWWIGCGAGVVIGLVGAVTWRMWRLPDPEAEDEL